MRLKVLPQELTICKAGEVPADILDLDVVFFARTDEEVSIVCETKDVPELTIEREDGWRALRIEGMLDFSLVGILSKLSAVLAAAGIGIFAVSTYNTDYVLVKGEDLADAIDALTAAGYEMTA